METELAYFLTPPDFVPTGKSTCVIVTFSNKDWFSDWEEDKVKKRGQVYENLKSVFVDQIWTQVLRHFPHLEDKVRYKTGERFSAVLN